MVCSASGTTAPWPLALHSANVGALFVWATALAVWQPPQTVAAISTRGTTVGSSALAA